MNRKKLLLFAVPILALTLVAAAVFIATLNVTATVSEAVSTTQTDVIVSAFPGGQTCEDIEINNAADWDLWVELTFAETSNPNAVVYTTDLPKTETLAPGTNFVNVCFDVTEDSPIGTIEGTVTIDRVAEPTP